MESGIGRRRAAALDEGGAAYQERRAEIIKAAGEVFKRQGFRGSKIGDIAQAVGMDRATIYYYVGSKEELFHQAVGDAVERNCLRAEAVLAGPGSPAEKLRTLVTELMVSYAESYPYLYLYIQEDLGPSVQRSQWGRTMARFNKRYENVVVAIVEDGVADGSFHAGTQPWVIAYGVIGMVAWSNRWFTPGTTPVSAREIGEAYAETLLGGLVRGPAVRSAEGLET
jgi:TetR/AcrR family transcriptional regulator, cholesterol catabolism regulator